MKIRIDVIIPSFRLEEKYIVPLLQLRRPEASEISFYLVSDNPSVQPSATIRDLVNERDVFLFINTANEGAAFTRNRGIDAGSGDWILLLDDDIIVHDNLLEVYANAIVNDTGETGFIGLINFPPPHSNFTSAIEASGSMDIFRIAARKPSFAWGATANVLVNRKAMGDIRFSPEYPKAGGGEDVDFFLRIRERNAYRNFKSLPEAVVEHPWWNEERPDFSRPFRYGIGNSRLGKLNPAYTYRDLLNTPETLLLGFILVIVCMFVQKSWVLPLLLFLAGILVIECIASGIQTFKRYHKANLAIVAYVIALRFVQETGVLWGKLAKGEVGRIGQRFHDNGAIRKIYFYRLNTYKTVKWVLYPLLVGWILWRY